MDKSSINKFLILNVGSANTCAYLFPDTVVFFDFGYGLGGKKPLDIKSIANIAALYKDVDDVNVTCIVTHPHNDHVNAFEVIIREFTTRGNNANIYFYLFKASNVTDKCIESVLGAEKGYNVRVDKFIADLEQLSKGNDRVKVKCISLQNIRKGMDISKVCESLVLPSADIKIQLYKNCDATDYTDGSIYKGSTGYYNAVNDVGVIFKITRSLNNKKEAILLTGDMSFCFWDNKKPILNNVKHIVLPHHGGTNNVNPDKSYVDNIVLRNMPVVNLYVSSSRDFLCLSPAANSATIRDFKDIQTYITNLIGPNCMNYIKNTKTLPKDGFFEI